MKYSFVYSFVVIRSWYLTIVIFIYWLHMWIVDPIRLLLFIHSNWMEFTWIHWNRYIRLRFVGPYRKMILFLSFGSLVWRTEKVILNYWTAKKKFIWRKYQYICTYTFHPYIDPHDAHTSNYSMRLNGRQYWRCCVCLMWRHTIWNLVDLSVLVCMAKSVA